MDNHLNYDIKGHGLQLVEISLNAGETVIAEAGAMLYMDDSIKFETRLGDGSTPNQGILGKLLSAGARVITGESVFMTHFTQAHNSTAKVAFAAPYPGTILPINLAEVYRNELIVQKDAFLCAEIGVKVSVAVSKRLSSGFFGGEGFIMQKLEGQQMAFIHAGGTLVERNLNNESILLDTGCLVAYESTVDFDIQRAGGLRSMLFGGEGLFLAKLSGTGKVWLQSMPVSKLVKALKPWGKNRKKGQNTVFGDFLER